MKRQEFIAYGHAALAVEKSTGTYVKYDDAQTEISRLQRALQRISIYCDPSEVCADDADGMMYIAKEALK